MTAGIAWQDPSSAILTDAEVSATSLSDLSSAVDLNGCVGLFSIGVQLTSNASATVAPILRIYASHDGTNYTDEPVYERTLVLRTTSAIEQLLPFPICSRYIKAAVYNGDGNTITSLTLYAHKNVLSTS